VLYQQAGPGLTSETRNRAPAPALAVCSQEQQTQLRTPVKGHGFPACGKNSPQPRKREGARPWSCRNRRKMKRA
jgi:hypothetical protein